MREFCNAGFTAGRAAVVALATPAQAQTLTVMRAIEAAHLDPAHQRAGQ